MTEEGEGEILDDEERVVIDLSNEAEEVMKELDNRTCTRCLHFEICQVFKNFKPMVSKMFPEENPPISAEDLAKVCDRFMLSAGR